MSDNIDGNRPNDDDDDDEDEEVRLAREHEQAMERIMLEQERQQEQQEQLQQEEEQAALLGPQDNDQEVPPAEMAPPQGRTKRMISYTKTSFVAAICCIWYALRTRQQWYLALVYLTSSKWAYIVLGNAIIAMCVATFYMVVNFFLSGLRHSEAEGLGDFFRWNVTETCLALTMFRSQITVKTAILFLILVLAKCLHWVVETRRSHFSMTQEAVLAIPHGRYQKWPAVQSQFVRIFIFLEVLLILDIAAVARCASNIAQHGPTVSVFFGFESAILFVSAMSNILLSLMHLSDGFIHWAHEQTSANHNEEQEEPPSRQYRLAHAALHAWKDHKATFTFAIEVQAQAAKFLFYIIFFGIVLTYYGMPLNLFREVYYSFQSLRQRLLAFAKYRKLMQSMNRYESLQTEEELEEAGRVCIICRDAMTLVDCKKLPGCGHVFHKSCLREWLIHQQTCPTCRGEIAATDARVRQAQDAAVAAAQRHDGAEAEQQEGAGQVEQAEQENEAGGQEEVRPAAPPAPAETQAPPAAAAETQPRLMERGTVSIPPPEPTSRRSKQLKDAPTDNTSPPFPCLYKIKDANGATVWNESETGEWISTRHIACGTLVLGTRLEWIRTSDWSGIMLKIPDGYLNEDVVARIPVALPGMENQDKGASVPTAIVS